MAEKEKQDFLTYKGKPLVRNGDTIYYGNMSDDYVIMMRITSKKTSAAMTSLPKSRCSF